MISKLKDLFNNGYKIVIFTNQAGITSGKTKIKPFKKKIENIISKLNLPIQVFISTGEYIYRKPMIGMWTELIENVIKMFLFIFYLYIILIFFFFFVQ